MKYYQHHREINYIEIEKKTITIYKNNSILKFA